VAFFAKGKRVKIFFAEIKSDGPSYDENGKNYE
jgi:hypothetical protein